MSLNKYVLILLLKLRMPLRSNLTGNLFHSGATWYVVLPVNIRMTQKGTFQHRITKVDAFASVTDQLINKLN